MTITFEQLRAGRLLLGWSLLDMALRTRVSEATIFAFERGRPTRKLDVEQARAVLEAAGVEFTSSGEPGAWIKVKTKGNDRDLIAALDAEQIWIIEHRGVDSESSLRRALQKALDLRRSGHAIASLKSREDGTTIEPEQIRRLFKRLIPQIGGGT